MAYDTEVLADSPLVYLRLNDASGDAQDSSGNNRDGVASGGLTYAQTGLIASDAGDDAVLFNGSSGQFAVPHESALNPAGGVSLECWVYITGDPTGNGNMMGKGGNLANSPRVRIDNDRAVTFLIGGNPLSTSAAAIPLNTKKHIVAVCDGTGRAIYIDGASAASDGFTWSAPSNTSDLIIGQNAAEFFAGVIDEAAYYGARLSAGRIAAHFAASIVATPKAVSDTVSLSENLGATIVKAKAVADTVALSEDLRAQVNRRIAEGLTPSEALASVLNPLDFAISLTAEAPLSAGPHGFQISLTALSNGVLPDFSISLTSQRALDDFQISLRSVPDVRSRFDLDIHRPVGRVEEE